MKTRELIRLLQEVDPSGEEEVCIWNQDIHFVHAEPAYWDGCLEILKRDEDCEYYNIIGAEVRSHGHKISIEPLSIEDAIYNDPDLPVEYSDYSSKYKEHHDKARQHCRELNAKYDRENEK